MIKYAFLFDLFLDKYFITTADLKSLHLSYNDINHILDDKVIKRVKRGLYRLEDINALFYYSLTLDSEKKEKGLHTCLFYKHTHIGANVAMFQICLKKKDYKNAIKNLSKFYNRLKKWKKQ